MADNTACSASSEYGGRRSRNGSRAGGAIEESSSKLDIFPGRALPRRIAEQRCRMIGDDQWDAIVPVQPSAEFADRLAGPQQRLCRKSAEGQHDLGAEELDLPNEIRGTSLHLVRQRIAVTGWPVLQHVADEDLFARQIDRAEDLRQQLAGLPDEWPPQLVLGRARSLADAD